MLDRSRLYIYSHSIVPGGLLVTSKRTSAICGSAALMAAAMVADLEGHAVKTVIASVESTGRRMMTRPSPVKGQGAMARALQILRIRPASVSFWVAMASASLNTSNRSEVPVAARRAHGERRRVSGLVV